jgi:hypothetical protein
MVINWERKEDEGNANGAKSKICMNTELLFWVAGENMIGACKYVRMIIVMHMK